MRESTSTGNQISRRQSIIGEGPRRTSTVGKADFPVPSSQTAYVEHCSAPHTGDSGDRSLVASPGNNSKTISNRERHGQGPPSGSSSLRVGESNPVRDWQWGQMSAVESLLTVAQHPQQGTGAPDTNNPRMTTRRNTFLPPRQFRCWFRPASSHQTGFFLQIGAAVATFVAAVVEFCQVSRRFRR